MFQPKDCFMNFAFKHEIGGKRVLFSIIRVKGMIRTQFYGLKKEEKNVYYRLICKNKVIG